MAGGMAAVENVPGRIRIKGRAPSAIRFFLIAVSFAMPFVLITSLLGYYSLWFGPQILLELTLAFYVPSIPVLIVLGQIEGPMDTWLGPTSSSLCRLLTGLLGCTLITGAFPFLPATHASLLWLVAALGTVSAIAFSTSYQVVQWFRHADIIALGLGGVTSGPLVLVLQLALNVGPLPERWQWIAMFEATACVTILGTLAAASLFAQYWNIMSGKEAYIDPRTPLLVTEQQAEEEAEEEGVMQMARAATENIMLTPDPFSSLPLLGEGSFRLDISSNRAARRSSLLHRCNSIGSCSNLPVEEGYHLLHHPPLVQHSPDAEARQNLHRFSSAHDSREDGRSRTRPGAPTSPATPLARKVADLAQRRMQHMQPLPGEGGGAVSKALDLAVPLAVPGDSKLGLTRQDGSTPQGQGEARSPFRGFLDPDYQQQLKDDVHFQVIPGGAAGPSVRPTDGWQPGGLQAQPGGEAGGDSGGCVEAAAAAAEGAGPGDVAGPKRKLTLQQENVAVWAGAWPVIVGFFTSVSVLYLVFPFFTYVPSSGKFGRELPQVLFFGRIFADIIGRFAPRRKALMVRAPMALLILGAIKVVLATLFFLYIKLIAFQFKSDLLISAVVIVLWLLGGYINTSSNILAPSLVAPELVGRASAILALAFQIAHFAGLLLAVLLAYVLYGDLVE